MKKKMSREENIFSERKITLRSHFSAIMELNSGKSFNDKAIVCNNFSSE
jgi:hypothetical protein